MKPYLRFLTRDDVFEFYGTGMPVAPILGFAMQGQDKVLAIGGVVDWVVPYAFSITTDEARRHPDLIVKMAVGAREVLSSFDKPVFATADPNEPSAHRFMRYIGLKQLTDSVYCWENEP